MSRVALTKNLRLVIAAVVALLVIAGGSWAYMAAAHSDVQSTYSAQHQLAQISYHGQNGKDALTLLKTHAQVTVKHYSFGDLVTAINGVSGNGPKYWTFYVNGKEANVGAGSYVTKDGDILKWVLQ